MKIYKRIISDSLKCMKLGSIISVAIALVVGIGAVIVNKGDILSTAYAVRGALLIAGSLTIILGSILILKKKSEKEFEYIEEWKAKYKKFSYKTVIILNGIIIVLYGGILDFILYKI